MYKIPNGFSILPDLNCDIPPNSSLTFTISTLPLVAFLASLELFQKLPRSPNSCAATFVSNISLNIALVLAIPDNSVIELNIEYLGSDISPSNFLITAGGSPVVSIISFINLLPGRSSSVLFK